MFWSEVTSSFEGYNLRQGTLNGASLGYIDISFFLRRLHDKEEEFEATRKNFLRAIDSMSASLEGETR